MDFSIIINTHDQSKFLGECIKSCINQNYLNYEIIIVDTSKKPSKNKHIKNKKIKYFHLKENSRKFPVLNQMHQIRYGFKKSKGKYICLLDGDDRFSSSKLITIFKKFKKSKIQIIQDIPILFSKDSKKKSVIKNYKKNIFFQKFFVSWPQVFGTSTISCTREILNTFFKKGKPFNYKFLAVDVKLIMFASHKFNVINDFEGVTLKRVHNRNLDKRYSNLFSSSFWLRRNMQMKYDYYLKKKIIFNLDYVITKIINIFL
ncbi:MAG: glycosyltransferase family 2 protein [Candidatus Pelagibacter sp.]